VLFVTNLVFTPCFPSPVSSGRAGQSGVAITLLGPKDGAFRDQLLSALGGGKCKAAPKGRGGVKTDEDEEEADGEDGDDGDEEPAGAENKASG